MASEIPIQNLYYLFCYAWNRHAEGAATDVGKVKSPELADLLAKVLVDGTNRLIRRGLERGYVPNTEDLPTVKGRVDIQASLGLLLQRKQRLACSFDEFETDILSNQVLISSIRRLAKVQDLDKDLRHQLGLICRRLGPVSPIRLTAGIFQQVRIHRNNAFYDFLMRVCELIFHCALPEDGGRSFRFTSILRDERQMAWVFEEFVRNFLRIEQRAFKVSKRQIPWDAFGELADLEKLPRMETDIHLERPGERIIIDTKYYAEMFQTRYDKKKVRSENLYQLLAYLKNSEAVHPDYIDAKGILLYPSTGADVRIRTTISGHPIEISTINLAQPWENIQNELLEVTAGHRT